MNAWLHKVLPHGEYYLADGGYEDVACASCITKHDLAPSELPKCRFIRARHEAVNKRFKEWEILQQKFRHAEAMHGAVFRAIAMLTQLEMEDGRPNWSIQRAANR